MSSMSSDASSCKRLFAHSFVLYQSTHFRSAHFIRHTIKSMSERLSERTSADYEISTAGTVTSAILQYLVFNGYQTSWTTVSRRVLSISSLNESTRQEINDDFWSNRSCTCNRCFPLVVAGFHTTFFRAVLDPPILSFLLLIAPLIPYKWIFSFESHRSQTLAPNLSSSSMLSKSWTLLPNYSCKPLLHIHSSLPKIIKVDDFFDVPKGSFLRLKAVFTLR